MPKLADNVNPKYRLHAQSGQALVSIAGRQILLGKYGSPESREKYERVIFEWRASGRQAPSRQAQDKTISELLVSYREHVLRYYRHPDGRPTGEAATIRGALRPLRLRYGATLAAEFGPLQLKALRESMIRPADGREGWARKTINKHINRIRQFFKWAVADGHIPGSVLEGLRAVDSLRPGRSEARETEPVRPVPEAFVYAVLPYVSRQVAAMIRLQMLTGARPGELCDMKATDIDRSGAVWIFKPQSHKTQHLSHSREILIGPKAQEILSPFLTHNLAAPVFSPFTAEAERRQRQHENRKTPEHIGNGPGDNRQAKPKWQPGASYTSDSYGRAIARGCDLAFPAPPELGRMKVKGQKGQRWESSAEWKARLGPDRWAQLQRWRAEHRWHPHQLRHNFATEMRRAHGLEMTKFLLGHKSVGAEVTELYAEPDRARASAIMEVLG